jgi:adenine nucleotide transporter 17
LIFLSTRAAVETKNENKVGSIICLPKCAHTDGEQTTYEAVKDIVKREGVLGLYSGLGSSLWGIAVTNG